VTRVDALVVIWLAREGIRSLIRAFARNVDAVRDANIAQLLNVIDRLQPRIIIALVTENSLSVGEKS
jgi:hypothetical protein